MNDTIYGGFIVAYMLPGFWLIVKQMDAEESVKTKRKLYPGRDIKDDGNKYLILDVLWGIGLAALLIAYVSGWPPIGGALAMIVALSVSFAIKTKLGW